MKARDLSNEDLAAILRSICVTGICPSRDEKEYLREAADRLEQKPETVTEFADRCRECGARYGKLLDQKSGKWIEHPEIETTTPEYLMFYECSECGDKPCFCKSDIHKKRFCSNCGCRMVEPQESEESEC